MAAAGRWHCRYVTDPAVLNAEAMPVTVELAGGKTKTEETSFERLSGAARLLTDSERDYTYYNLSLGYNILPGEGFVGRKRALNTQMYVIGGVGSTNADVEAYWLRQFDSIPALPELPADRPLLVWFWAPH